MRPTGVGDPGRRLPCLLVLGMLLWLGGCAERRGPEPPQPKASELEARFRARAETGSLRGNLRGRVAADVDGRFRVEVMDPLGRPVWVLAYDGSLLSAALPREGRWFRGEAPAELALDARRPIWRLLTGPDRWESSGPGGSVLFDCPTANALSSLPFER